MSLYKFVATKGREIQNVNADSIGGLKLLHREYFKFGWNVSEAFNNITSEVILKAKSHEAKK